MTQDYAKEEKHQDTYSLLETIQLQNEMQMQSEQEMVDGYSKEMK